MLVYVRSYFEATIAGILIFFKVFSNYKKLKEVLACLKPHKKKVSTHI